MLERIFSVLIWIGKWIFIVTAGWVLLSAIWTAVVSPSDFTGESVGLTFLILLGTFLLWRGLILLRKMALYIKG